MDQDVTEGDDPGMLRNARERPRIASAEVVQRFADDLKVTLDRRSEKIVGAVIIQRGFPAVFSMMKAAARRTSSLPKRCQDDLLAALETNDPA